MIIDDFSLGDSCESYVHPQYGKTGRCIATTSCPNSLYISNLCESQPANIKCCFSSSGSTGCKYKSLSFYLSLKSICLAASCPSIVSRSAWGARAAKSTTSMGTPAPYVVIHHTTGGTCTTKTDCISKMKGFQNYHMDSNGKRTQSIE